MKNYRLVMQLDDTQLVSFIDVLPEVARVEWVHIEQHVLHFDVLQVHLLSKLEVLELLLSEGEGEQWMGSGKGAPEYWVAVVKAQKVMFEIGGVDEAVAKEALRLAQHKLPIKTKIVKREDVENGGEV